MKKLVLSLLLLCNYASADQTNPYRQITVCQIQEISPDEYASNNCISWRNGKKFGEKSIVSIIGRNQTSRQPLPGPSLGDLRQIYDQIDLLIKNLDHSIQKVPTLPPETLQ